eukprot:36989-Rhodomonas_salina.2
MVQRLAGLLNSVRGLRYLPNGNPVGTDKFTYRQQYLPAPHTTQTPPTILFFSSCSVANIAHSSSRVFAVLMSHLPQALHPFAHQLTSRSRRLPAGGQSGCWRVLTLFSAQRCDPPWQNGGCEGCVRAKERMENRGDAHKERLAGRGTCVGGVDTTRCKG